MLVFLGTQALGAPADAGVRGKPDAGVSFPGLEAFSGGSILKLEQQPEVYGFDVTIHSGMLDNAAASRCTDLVSWAQWRQDIFSYGDSAAHFDNCAWDESLALIQSLLAEVEQLIAEARLRKAAGKSYEWMYDDGLHALGRAVHGIEDFYSHTNFIELNKDAAKESELMKLELWLPTARQAIEGLKTKGLVSGVYGGSNPKHCASNALTHEQLAKDNKKTATGKRPFPANWANGRNHHLVALDVARDAGGRFLQYAFKRWPELAQHCAPAMWHGVLFEERK
ncbi:MAG: HET-C-related protein [Myxococcota bacterium]